jgi:hypothetical protein
MRSRVLIRTKMQLFGFFKILLWFSSILCLTASIYSTVLPVRVIRQVTPPRILHTSGGSVCRWCWTLGSVQPSVTMRKTKLSLCCSTSVEDIIKNVQVSGHFPTREVFQVNLQRRDRGNNPNDHYVQELPKSGNCRGPVTLLNQFIHVEERSEIEERCGERIKKWAFKEIVCHYCK